MSEKEPNPEHLLELAREALLNAASQGAERDILYQKIGHYLDALDVVGEQNYSVAERDLWHYATFSETLLEAGLADDAEEAIKDLELVMDRTHDYFLTHRSAETWKERYDSLVACLTDLKGA